MDGFAPGLREAVVGLAEDLRFIVFFLCVAGFILRVARGRGDLDGTTGPLVRAIVVVAMVAAIPWWFEFAERMFLTVAEVVHHGYTDHPMQTAERLRATVGDGDAAFSLRRIGESLYKAFLFGAAKLIVLVASLLQLPFLLLQYVLKLLCFLFLPVALGCFMVPSLESLGRQYLQQTLAVLAWPVGFAVTELVAYYLLTSYQNNLAAAYGLTPGEIDPTSYLSVIGGLLAALWMILGTLGTPLLMQLLFCSGAPLSGGGQSGLQHLYVLQQVGSLVASVKTGGAAAPGLAARSTGHAAPPPSTPLPPPPGAPVPPPAPDRTGDTGAARMVAQGQLPAPYTTI